MTDNSGLISDADKEKKTLFGISEELCEFMANIEVDLETGEIEEGAASKMDELYDNFEEKAQDCVNYLRRTDAEAKLAKEEAEKIKAYSKVLDNKVKWMSTYIKDMMIKVGIKKVIVSGRPATIAKNPMSVEVDMTRIPVDWTIHKVDIKPDKKAIIKHVKEGKETPAGVIVINDKISLRY